MKTFSRRSFLQGAGGAALALPCLESVASAKAANAAGPAQRLAFFYVPIGVVRSGFFPGEANVRIPSFQGPNTKAVESALPVGWIGNPTRQSGIYLFALTANQPALHSVARSQCTGR